MPVPHNPPDPPAPLLPPPTTASGLDPDPDPILTVEELARLLRLNRKTVYEAFQRGQIPGGRRIGRTIRFARAVVLAWLAAGDPPPRARARPRLPPLPPPRTSR